MSSSSGKHNGSSFESSLDVIRKGLSSYAPRLRDKMKIDSTQKLYVDFPSEEALRDTIGMSFVQRKCLVRWKEFLVSTYIYTRTCVRTSRAHTHTRRTQDTMSKQKLGTAIFISAEGQYFAVTSDILAGCKAAYSELQKNATGRLMDGAQLRFPNVTSRSMTYVIKYLSASKQSHDERVSELEQMSKAFVSEIMNASYTLGVDALCSACREAMKNMFQIADVTDMLREFGKTRRHRSMEKEEDEEDHERTKKPEDKEIEAFRRRLFQSATTVRSFQRDGGNDNFHGGEQDSTTTTTRLQLPGDLKKSLQRSLKRKLRKERR